MLRIIKNIIICYLVLGFFSCDYKAKEKTKIAEPAQYIGWWIYGEGQHIFKDEVTLGEWEIVFLNEDIKELRDLYLSICEMEYFPMECIMYGDLYNDTLKVDNFEITYIEGCGE